MSHELVYTSAPRGLKPGSKGFCTVACTADLPESLAPVVGVIPGQLVTEALARRLGRDPDRPPGLTKVTQTR